METTITTKSLAKAQALVRLYEAYATPERALLALRSVDEGIYDGLMAAAVGTLEAEHADAFELVREKLLADAVEAEKKRQIKNERQRRQRAIAKQAGEPAAVESGASGHVQRM